LQAANVHAAIKRTARIGRFIEKLPRKRRAPYQARANQESRLDCTACRWEDATKCFWSGASLVALDPQRGK
jgi:hypothetical protein